LRNLFRERHTGDLTITRGAVLAANSLILARSDQDGEVQQVLSTGTEVFDLRLGVVLKGEGPSIRLAEVELSKVESGARQLRREELEVLVIENGVFKIEVSGVAELVVGFDDIEEASEEHVAGGDGQLELESGEDGAFHSHDFFAVVGVGSDGHAFSNSRGPHFFVLGGDPDGGDTDELELSAGNRSDGEVAIDNICSEVVSLRAELELEGDVDEPVDEDGAHLFVNFSLAAEVVRVGKGFLFALEEDFDDVVAEFRGTEGVNAVHSVNTRRTRINGITEGNGDVVADHRGVGA